MKSYKNKMSNLLAFLGTFSAYLILFAVFVVVAVVAVFVGISMRKSKNKKAEMKEETVTE